MSEQTRPAGQIWKILRFPLVRIVLASVWLFLTVSLTQAAVKLLPAHETIPIRLLSTAIVVVVAWAAYYAFVRVIEKRPLNELAASHAVGELAMGTLIGALLFTIVIGILGLLGCYRISGTNHLTVVVPVFTLAVLSGVVEEILIRGILFRMTEELLGTWLALLFSAFLFGMLHLGNPNATFWAALAIAIEAGILLAAAFTMTRRLWLAIGIHFAWNFTQGGIFGVVVSGMQTSGFLRATLSGPVLLSGGAFGAEASVIAVIVCLTAGVYMIWKTLQKGNLVKPIWKR